MCACVNTLNKKGQLTAILCLGCAAAIGIRAGLETSEKPLGRLTIMGTPAEEAIGGKVKMIEQGCFQDIDIALMVHPFPSDSTVATFISVCCLNATFTGKASHAAAFPWEGINALDAAVSAYNAISMLRQQMKPDWRVHGIISNGGAKPNIIPEKSTLEYFVRTPTAAELDVLAGKVKNIFESAAQASGCQVDVEEVCRYSNVINNSDLMQLFRSNSESLGVQFDEKERMAGSTDMGNVSHTVPSIHPLYSIGTDAFNHTRHFTAAANTDYAHSKTLIAAKSIAMTAIDVLTNPEMLKKVKATFRCQLQEAA